jgi:hypothetical protein
MRATAREQSRAFFMEGFDHSVQDLPEASDETPSFGVRLNLRVENGYEVCAKLSKRNGARLPEKRS